MDSRAYVFIFGLNEPADIPADFLLATEKLPFEMGVFIPQSGRADPARLLLLTKRCLYVIPHPTTGQPSYEFDLDDLAQLETGTHLLRGWIHFTTRSATHRIIYNTRASDPLERFLNKVRQRWVGEPPETNRREPTIIGEKPDVKFKNMLHAALAPNESVLLQFFSAPLQTSRKFLTVRRVNWSPGNLLALTSGNSLLWLKEEYRDRRERLAGIAVSSPLSLLRSAEAEPARANPALLLTFQHGLSWRIPACHDHSGLIAALLSRRPEPVSNHQPEPSPCQSQRHA